MSFRAEKPLQAVLNDRLFLDRLLHNQGLQIAQHEKEDNEYETDYETDITVEPINSDHDNEGGDRADGHDGHQDLNSDDLIKTHRKSGGDYAFLVSETSHLGNTPQSHTAPRLHTTVHGLGSSAPATSAEADDTAVAGTLAASGTPTAAGSAGATATAQAAGTAAQGTGTPTQPRTGSFLQLGVQQPIATSKKVSMESITMQKSVNLDSQYEAQPRTGSIADRRTGDVIGRGGSLPAGRAYEIAGRAARHGGPSASSVPSTGHGGALSSDRTSARTTQGSVPGTTSGRVNGGATSGGATFNAPPTPRLNQGMNALQLVDALITEEIAKQNKAVARVAARHNAQQIGKGLGRMQNSPGPERGSDALHIGAPNSGVAHSDVLSSGIEQNVLPGQVRENHTDYHLTSQQTGHPTSQPPTSQPPTSQLPTSQPPTSQQARSKQPSSALEIVNARDDAGSSLNFTSMGSNILNLANTTPIDAEPFAQTSGATKILSPRGGRIDIPDGSPGGSHGHGAADGSANAMTPLSGKQCINIANTGLANLRSADPSNQQRSAAHVLSQRVSTINPLGHQLISSVSARMAEKVKQEKDVKSSCLNMNVFGLKKEDALDKLKRKKTLEKLRRGTGTGVIDNHLQVTGASMQRGQSIAGAPTNRMHSVGIMPAGVRASTGSHAVAGSFGRNVSPNSPMGATEGPPNTVIYSSGIPNNIPNSMGNVANSMGDADNSRCSPGSLKHRTSESRRTAEPGSYSGGSVLAGGSLLATNLNQRLGTGIMVSHTTDTIIQGEFEESSPTASIQEPKSSQVGNVGEPANAILRIPSPSGMDANIGDATHKSGIGNVRDASVRDDIENGDNAKDKTGGAGYPGGDGNGDPGGDTGHDFVLPPLNNNKPVVIVIDDANPRNGEKDLQKCVAHRTMRETAGEALRFISCVLFIHLVGLAAGYNAMERTALYKGQSLNFWSMTIMIVIFVHGGGTRVQTLLANGIIAIYGVGLTVALTLVYALVVVFLLPSEGLTSVHIDKVKTPSAIVRNFIEIFDEAKAEIIRLHGHEIGYEASPNKALYNANPILRKMDFTFFSSDSLEAFSKFPAKSTIEDWTAEAWESHFDPCHNYDFSMTHDVRKSDEGTTSGATSNYGSMDRGSVGTDIYKRTWDGADDAFDLFGHANDNCDHISLDSILRVNKQFAQPGVYDSIITSLNAHWIAFLAFAIVVLSSLEALKYIIQNPRYKRPIGTMMGATCMTAYDMYAYGYASRTFVQFRIKNIESQYASTPRLMFVADIDSPQNRQAYIDQLVKHWTVHGHQRRIPGDEIHSADNKTDESIDKVGSTNTSESEHTGEEKPSSWLGLEEATSSALMSSRSEVHESNPSRSRVQAITKPSLPVWDGYSAVEELSSFGGMPMELSFLGMVSSFLRIGQSEPRTTTESSSLSGKAFSLLRVVPEDPTWSDQMQQDDLSAGNDGSKNELGEPYDSIKHDSMLDSAILDAMSNPKLLARKGKKDSPQKMLGRKSKVVPATDDTGADPDPSMHPDPSTDPNMSSDTVSMDEHAASMKIRAARADAGTKPEGADAGAAIRGVDAAGALANHENLVWSTFQSDFRSIYRTFRSISNDARELYDLRKHYLWDFYSAAIRRALACVLGIVLTIMFGIFLPFLLPCLMDNRKGSAELYEVTRISVNGTFEAVLLTLDSYVSEQKYRERLIGKDVVKASFRSRADSFRKGNSFRSNGETGKSMDCRLEKRLDSRLLRFSQSMLSPQSSGNPDVLVLVDREPESQGGVSRPSAAQDVGPIDNTVHDDGTQLDGHTNATNSTQPNNSNSSQARSLGRNDSDLSNATVRGSDRGARVGLGHCDTASTAYTPGFLESLFGNVHGEDGYFHALSPEQQGYRAGNADSLNRAVIATADTLSRRVSVTPGSLTTGVNTSEYPSSTITETAQPEAGNTLLGTEDSPLLDSAQGPAFATESLQPEIISEIRSGLQRPRGIVRFRAAVQRLILAMRTLRFLEFADDTEREVAELQMSVESRLHEPADIQEDDIILKTYTCGLTGGILDKRSNAVSQKLVTTEDWVRISEQWRELLPMFTSIRNPQRNLPIPMDDLTDLLRVLQSCFTSLIDHRLHALLKKAKEAGEHRVVEKISRKRRKEAAQRVTAQSVAAQRAIPAQDEVGADVDDIDTTVRIAIGNAPNSSSNDQELRQRTPNWAITGDSGSSNNSDASYGTMFSATSNVVSGTTNLRRTTTRERLSDTTREWRQFRTTRGRSSSIENMRSGGEQLAFSEGSLLYAMEHPDFRHEIPIYCTYFTAVFQNYKTLIETLDALKELATETWKERGSASLRIYIERQERMKARGRNVDEKTIQRKADRQLWLFQYFLGSLTFLTRDLAQFAQLLLKFNLFRDWVSYSQIYLKLSEIHRSCSDQ